MIVTPAAAYRRTSVETSSPGHLVLMLYRRAIQCTREGVGGLERNDLERANQNLLRAQDIVFELSAALSPDGGPLAESLAALYDYFHRQLTEANLRKDPTPAGHVAEMLESLLDAWETVLEPTAQPAIAVGRVTTARQDYRS